jgi:cysteine-rich repeat protein
MASLGMRPVQVSRVLLVLVLSGSGCVAPVEPLDETGEREPIVGGSEEWGFPLVGALAGNAGAGLQAFCTATPVTPTVLITAAHCLDAFSEFGGTIVFAQLAPDGRGPTHNVVSSSRRTHPFWSMYDPCRYVMDIGVVSLSDPIDADMFPQLHNRGLTAGDAGTPLKVVGFGVSSPPSGGAGTKRSINMQVTDIVTDRVPYEFGCTSPPSPYQYQYFTMVLSNYYNGVCYGDSGGPSFVPGEHRDIQYGVHARTQVEECGPAEDTSVGYFFDLFIRSNVLSLDPSAEACGDGICTGLEREDNCAADCSPFVCGDGTPQGPEVCDDGNTSSGDGCSADCLSNETCPNGIADTAVGEVCDDGNATGGDGCSADCRSNETCPNGITDEVVGEVCDDGNVTSGDGCSADCRSDETCGNAIIDIAAGEVCDDANAQGGDGCSADCRSDETCGNGVRDRTVGETCDDGNQVDGDGCPADCHGLQPNDLTGLTGSCGCRATGSTSAPLSSTLLVGLLGAGR